MCNLSDIVKITFLFLVLILLINKSHAASNSIIAVDKDGTVGQYTSLVLDAQGYPIMSYYDASEQKLKVVHCFEKNCALLNTIVTPDAAVKTSKHSAITLDKNGNPVVSYYDEANSALKVLHCGNSSCSTGNTIASPDTAGVVGQYTALTIDSNNKPIVTYYDVTNGKLKVLHCGNAACNAGNVIATPDNASSNGVQSSIKLNAAGNPIIVYFDFTNSALKLLRCGNVNCTAGNNITTLDSVGNVGGYPSLILDSNDKPIISYLDLTNGKLKVLRCGNTSCSAGNTMTSFGNKGVVGYFSSLALDNANKPIVSFYDQTNSKLNILRCGNTTCATGNTIVIPDNSGQVGQYTSLKLDTNNHPVVSYYDASQGDLKLLHCGSETCSPNSIVVADNAGDVGEFTSIKLDNNGNPVVSYRDNANDDLKLLHCGNANCTAGNTVISAYAPNKTGWDTSLALDANGKPVISFYDFTAKIMKVLHCSNGNCTGANNPNQPDVFSHRHTSLALDASGKPVIATNGQSDQGLRVVHCGDATCNANTVATSPDSPAYPFNADVRGVSMVLDSNGNPVISFYRADKGQLKILHCADATCTGPGNSIAVIDPGTQSGDHRATSITLDKNGNPVVAYQDTANNALKVLHCGNANCTANNSITSPSTGMSTGVQPAIKLDASGNPVVSFGSNNGMSVLHCGDATCTANNSIVVIDPSATGWDSSLILDANGNPVVSYYNHVEKDLKVVHCGTATCA